METLVCVFDEALMTLENDLTEIQIQESSK